MTAEIDLIVWNDSLMTGVQEIDDQHQILVNMINDANVKLSTSSGRAYLEEVIRELISYALYHFDAEEELMVEQNYTPGERETFLRTSGIFTKGCRRSGRREGRKAYFAGRSSWFFECMADKSHSEDR